MKYLKKYKSFFEDGTACASAGVAGSGDVTNAIVGNLAGVGSISGSGDISFYLKKQKRKKGNPSQVTDMRDLAPAKGITKVKESNSESRDPANDSKTRNMINDCIIELYDLDFELVMMDYQKEREFVDLDDDGSDGGYIDYEELRISFHKMISQNWTGNYSIRCRFDKDGENNRKVSTLRARGSEMTGEEQMLFDIVDDVAIKLINSLDYQYGYFTMEWSSVGGIYFNSDRNISINVSFVLYNNLKN